MNRDERTKQWAEEAKRRGFNVEAVNEALRLSRAKIATGDRVRLTADVERYPHFIAAKGSTGVVLDVNSSEWPKTIAVQMDEPLDGAEEWDNCVLWSDEEREDFPSQVEKI